MEALENDSVLSKAQMRAIIRYTLSVVVIAVHSCVYIRIDWMLANWRDCMISLRKQVSVG